MPEHALSLEAVLPLKREAAFALTVDRIASWWPRHDPFFGQSAKDVIIDPHLGGACSRVDEDGRRVIWGTVLSIEAPLYLRLAWQIGPDGKPVADPAAASRVVLSFRDAGRRRGLRSPMEISSAMAPQARITGLSWPRRLVGRACWPP
ncbi:hypothetical protein [Pannonibacter phragmitetus]|uniref:hypothetical protein n=1 Tax=Pannonibacter phragmitetus TaxID=121719 RepID=UPI003D2F1DB2